MGQMTAMLFQTPNRLLGVGKHWEGPAAGRPSGAVVLLTYTNDYPADDEPSLSARRALANANNVHWFHSIHSNATGWTSNTTVNYTLMLVREEITTRQPSWPEAVTMSNIIGPAIQAKLRNSPRTTWTYLDYTFYGGTNGGFTWRPERDFDACGAVRGVVS
jgi:hypothetical protein